MDSWGAITFDALVDGSTGSYPLPAYASYGSSRHVPNSTIDVTQYTGTGAAYVTYNVRLTAAEYVNLIAAYRVIPRDYDTLTVGTALGDWYLDGVEDPQQMIDGSVMCTVTFREYT